MEGSFPINETAHKLFYSLLERAAAGRFDEAFLLNLVRYHQAFPANGTRGFTPATLWLRTRRWWRSNTGKRRTGSAASLRRSGG